jgi:SH3 domain protein
MMENRRHDNFWKKRTAPLVTGLFLFSLLLTAAAAAQESRFVHLNGDIPVRRGQGNGYKIIKMIKNGEKVELISINEGWARIRAADGKEGWMLKRFLSEEAPPFKLVQILRSENDQLIAQNTKLNQELSELKQLQTTTGADLSVCISQRDTIDRNYKDLQADTADVMAIKNRMAATEKEIKEVRLVLEDVQQQNTALKKKATLLWFLAGGGVLLLGWLIGLVTGGSRKKRSSLM